jgi:phosphoglycolate phosphatase
MNLSLTGFTGIIFDLDGTLVDSVPDLSLAINHGLAQMKLPEVAESQVRLWVGNGSRKLVERSLLAHSPSGELDEAQAEQLHQIFLVSYKQFLRAESVLYPGVIHLLKYLKANEIPVGLVTNKPMAFVPPLLASLKIDQYFSAVIGGDSLAEKKPSPLPLLHIAHRLEAEVKDCLMVGDSASDVLSAQAANMPCVLLRQGYNQGQDLAALNPDWLLDTISELSSALIR